MCFTSFVVLVSAAINLLVKSAEKLHKGAVLADGTQQVPIREFMDDLTITVRSVPKGRWTLEDLLSLPIGQGWRSSNLQIP